MLGVLAATISNCLIGAILYNEKAPTGRLWMSRTFPGKTSDEFGEQSRMAMGFSVVASISVNLLLKFIILDFFHMKVALDAVKFSIGLSSLLFLQEVSHVLFAKRSVDVFIVDQIVNILSLMASALCIFYLG